MKYKFETDDELEAKQIIKVKDVLYALNEIINYCNNNDHHKIHLENIYEILDDKNININDLWVQNG